MTKNETRKRCPRCRATFVARTAGGVQTTDGIHCVECRVELMMEAFSRPRSATDGIVDADDLVKVDIERCDLCKLPADVCPCDGMLDWEDGV